MFVNTAMEEGEIAAPAEPARRKAATTASLNISKKNATRLKRVSSILRKKHDSLTPEERRILEENSELVEQFYKRRERRAVWQSRKTEQEDSPELLEAKCEQLAQAIHDAEFLVVYTGAGISTAASIPDYRGPNGIWTMLQKGLDIGHHDLSAAEPTLTHMALSALYHQSIVRHVVSQNCDGLHLRSGLPKTAMSEVHGNMYIEVCKHCVPAREYVRTFDVTERTSIYKHTTGRRCYRCGEPLIDTIVHFGERGKLRWPLNWQGACQAANACDTILCLGSSLKVLKKYPWLWQMDRPPKKRPQLYIVNLQWTPKDKDATLKINGKCDVVMALVMKAMGYELPYYSRASDPIFHLSTPLHPGEYSTTTRPHLQPPTEDEEEPVARKKGEAGSVSVSDVRWRKDGADESKKRRIHVEADEYLVDNEIKNDIKSENESKCDIKTVNGLTSTWDIKAAHLSESEGSLLQEKFKCNSFLLCDDSLIKREDDIEHKIKDEETSEEKVWVGDTHSECSQFVKEENSLISGSLGEEEFKSDPMEEDEIKNESMEEEPKSEPVEEEEEEDEDTRNEPSDEEEVKSETLEEDLKSDGLDSDDESQLSDVESCTWMSENLSENFLNTNVNSLKTSESSCSESDLSEKADCEKGNDSDSPVRKCNNIDYFKLAYSSTNVKMAKHGQALLKQNDFYGTGLCIRSLGESPITSGKEMRAKSASNGIRTNVFFNTNEVSVSEQCQENVTDQCINTEQLVSTAERDNANTYLNPASATDSKMSSLPNCHDSPSILSMCSSDSSDKVMVPNSLIETEESDLLVQREVLTSSNLKENLDFQLKQTYDRELSLVVPQFHSSVLPVEKECVVKSEEVCVNAHSAESMNTIVSNSSTDEYSQNGSIVADGSFLLRTHIVDGIIRTACVETLAENESECKEEIPVACDAPHDSFPRTCEGQTQLLNSTEVKYSVESSESEELKSIWYQSFCGTSSNNIMGTTKKEERSTNKSNHQSSEKSSSVILKNICTEAMNDRQKGATKRKFTGCDNDDVKYIWFWGFDSNSEVKEKDAIGNVPDRSNKAQDVNSSPEVDIEGFDSGDSLPVGRVTRSRTRASCDSKVEPEPDVFKCHCNGSNPELCKLAKLKPAKVKCDEVQKARDIINRRRTCNYRRFEPVFEKNLQSLTYERAKTKRKSKFEQVQNNEDYEEEEELEEQENEMKEEADQKMSDGEEFREKDEKEEKKITPGWYGKGLRKGMKKKTRV
ncbi:uncharacterized protein Sirt7 [Penaeus vannamei]|uniref:uncharacterized protein Sirt7 n=1 Tax=Penaeus vannamei TaxID=6689 RepID=UPI00387F4A76